jgi:hypothetical protein
MARIMAGILLVIFGLLTSSLATYHYFRINHVGYMRQQYTQSKDFVNVAGIERARKASEGYRKKQIEDRQNASAIILLGVGVTTCGACLRQKGIRCLRRRRNCSTSKNFLEDIMYS